MPGYRLVPVDGKVAEELAAIARRVGLTVAELVNTILAQAAKTLKARDDVAVVLADSAVYADASRLGAIPVPAKAVAALLKACVNAEREACRMFLEELARFARLIALSARARGVGAPEGLPLLARILFAGSVPNTAPRSNGLSQLVLVSPDESLLDLYEPMARGLVEGLGGTIVSSERNGNVLTIVFRLEPRERLGGRGQT